MRKIPFVLIVPVLALVLTVRFVQAQDEAGDLLARINNLRAARGLPGYNINGALSAAAQQQAQWIVETGNVSHTHPDGSGPRSRALDNGYGSTEVSENIYGGTMATADIAWTFWVNSGIHLAGLTNPRYQEIGIGIAAGAWGRAYVTVFGNPGGPPLVVQQASSGGGAAVNAAPFAPSYVVGQDEWGNIKHEVQPGDTLGDIALIYGYTWDDLPYMMQLNEIADVRDLEVGSIFLVPPHDGTFTPTPGEPPAGTPMPTPEATSAPASMPEPTSEPPTAEPTLFRIATAASAPESILGDETAGEVTPEAVALLVAAAPTHPAGTPDAAVPPATGVTIIRSGPSPWLGIAIAVQVGILALAAFEFFRRARRKK